MRSPASAIAWEFSRRHRWGFLAIGAYLAAMGLLKLVVTLRGTSIVLDDAQTFAVAVLVPLASAYTYFLAVFTFGLTGDLAARQSMYAARMFSLPVRTAALAGWPMLYGGLAVTALWIPVRLFAPWPPGTHVPLLWPAVFGAALLAWTQALTWLPYPVRGMRVVVAVLWLVAIDTMMLVALYLRAPEPLMLAIYAPQIPLAFLLARYAVGRARRGDLPAWQSVRTVDRATSAPPFPSPAHAERWFEWRRYGLTLPGIVAVLLPFELALLFLADDAPALVFFILCGALLTPSFMASFAAATVAKANPDAREPYGVSAFLATRPMTTAQLVGARVAVTVASTVVTWVLVGIMIPVALLWSGAWAVVTDAMSRFIAHAGAARAAVIGVLLIAMLLLSTWRQLVQSMYLGFTGRGWLIKGSVFAMLTMLTIGGLSLVWISASGHLVSVVWTVLSWTPLVLVPLKMTAAAYVAVRLHARRLFNDRLLLIGALAWSILVLALYGTMVWIVDTRLIQYHLLGLYAVLFVPLVRLSLATLALDWNRHR